MHFPVIDSIESMTGFITSGNFLCLEKFSRAISKKSIQTKNTNLFYFIAGSLEPSIGWRDSVYSFSLNQSFKNCISYLSATPATRTFVLRGTLVFVNKMSNGGVSSTGVSLPK